MTDVHQEVLAAEVEEDTEDFVPQTQPVMVVQEAEDLPGTGLSSEELREGIKKTYTRVQTDYFDLACMLYEAFKESKYKSWGYETWKDYLQQELGFKVAKANYLKNIWRNLGDKPEI